VADRDALVEKVAVALYVESDSDRTEADRETDLDWRDHRAFWREQARAVLAVPEVAAAFDLADRMRDAETTEWTRPEAGRSSGVIVDTQVMHLIRKPGQSWAFRVCGPWLADHE
jgi:hypothetical protein